VCVSNEEADDQDSSGAGGIIAAYMAWSCTWGFIQRIALERWAWDG
jgi:hypothetical protein